MGPQSCLPSGLCRRRSEAVLQGPWGQLGSQTALASSTCPLCREDCRVAPGVSAGCQGQVRSHPHPQSSLGRL